MSQPMTAEKWREMISGPAPTVDPLVTEYHLFLRMNSQGGKDTWGSVSFEDWRDLVLPTGRQEHWDDFVKRRQAKHDKISDMSRQC